MMKHCEVKRTRRVAASRVYVNAHEFHNNHVVEFMNSCVSAHYPLSHELSMTEWLGGVIIFLPTAHINVESRSVNNVRELFVITENENETRELHAFHISNVDLATGELTFESEIRLLE